MAELSRRALAMCALLLPFHAYGQAVSESIPGKRSEFHSFRRIDFSFQDRDCIVVQPNVISKGKPWIWRARFFGHEPQLDIELLKLGYHVAYVDVAGMFGAPEAVAIWDQFYQFLTVKHGFHPRPVLEGMSRGGLVVYNWAKANPEQVACIYADAPVCDIKSWPGGKGKGIGGGNAWQQCLQAYGLTEDDAMTATVNPIDGLEQLAKADVPLLHVVGDADEVVPVDENTEILEQRYRNLGGRITVIHKPDIGHHPHSLKDPTPIVTFIVNSSQQEPSL